MAEEKVTPEEQEALDMFDEAKGEGMQSPDPRLPPQEQSESLTPLMALKDILDFYEETDALSPEIIQYAQSAIDKAEKSQLHIFDLGYKAAQSDGVTKHTRRTNKATGYEEVSAESLSSVELGETAKGEVYVKSIKAYHARVGVAADTALDEYRRLRRRMAEAPSEEE